MRVLAFACAVAALTGCQSVPEQSAENARATAQLLPTQGNKTFGEATFEQIDSKVRVTVFVQGLKPGQQHGMHIHQVGDCGNQGENAADHFDPFNKPHGPPASAERHAGDLPALNANKQGRANIQADVDLIALTPGPNSIVGRALIVHANPDDYKSQPSGNAGNRIACGVIRAG
jgi:Cu-Zn family superoxide dismutase